jgi:hypothetical protein
MLKKSLFVVALVAVLAGMAQAGEIKVHDWPIEWSYQYQEITTIPVRMDVGYWLNIPDQDDLKIKLEQSAIHTYEGCTPMTVQCNFDVALATTIEATGEVSGEYTSWVTPTTLTSGGGSVDVCAKLTKADLGDKPGGTDNVHVANVTVWVAPVPTSGSDSGNVWSGAVN